MGNAIPSQSGTVLKPGKSQKRKKKVKSVPIMKLDLAASILPEFKKLTYEKNRHKGGYPNAYNFMRFRFVIASILLKIKSKQISVRLPTWGILTRWKRVSSTFEWRGGKVLGCWCDGPGFESRSSNLFIGFFHSTHNSFKENVFDDANILIYSLFVWLSCFGTVLSSELYKGIN